MLIEIPEILEIQMIPGYDASEFMSIMGAFTKADDRGKPFDPNSVADLKQALMLAVAAYRIPNHYYSETNDRIKSDNKSDTFCDIMDNLDYDAERDANSEDEDADDFESATWEDVFATIAEIQAFSKQYTDNMAKALTAFEKLSETYSGHLSMLLKVILTSPNDVQREILGNAYYISPKIIDDKLKELLTAADDREPYDTMDDSLKAFIKTLNEKWAYFELPIE